MTHSRAVGGFGMLGARHSHVSAGVREAKKTRHRASCTAERSALLASVVRYHHVSNASTSSTRGATPIRTIIQRDLIPGRPTRYLCIPITQEQSKRATDKICHMACLPITFKRLAMD
ncbi:hypothetical protein DAEQUDRAFT_435081 [Daedalea quercina L-15889]|uniref:Uncharacterized protein n=1 Tax=Daedalea quercina L-15889 TaxID=1314783 RepID=A0A165ND76_9APHY|nr:hypothetical protein DAEQUDRAFT_435081 [Daedalea quercina L-15889]